MLALKPRQTLLLRSFNFSSNNLASLERSIEQLGSVDEANKFYYATRPLFMDQHYVRLMRKVLEIEKVTAAIKQPKSKKY